jgi:hypothetical protein
VDIGAYEFQSPGSVISYAWPQRYGLPIDGSADFIDSDADGMSNWQEWVASTVPTNALSALRMLSPTNGGSGIQVTWQSLIGKRYFLERATNLLDTAPFTLIATNIMGVFGSKTFTDTNALGTGPFFYRVGVQQ